MELMQAIYSRRSIRRYKSQPVPRELVQQLLAAAVMAPSGSNAQPWSFVIIQDKELLKKYSDRAKVLALEQMRKGTDPYGYQKLLSDPDFNIFYNAGTLIIIYGDQSPTAYVDCSLAAQNLMLAAHGLGLGSCWIGFSSALCNSPEFKEELWIPENLTAVAPLIIGYPDAIPHEFNRKEPQILVWK